MTGSPDLDLAPPSRKKEKVLSGLWVCWAGGVAGQSSAGGVDGVMDLIQSCLKKLPTAATAPVNRSSVLVLLLSSAFACTSVMTN